MSLPACAGIRNFGNCSVEMIKNAKLFRLLWLGSKIFFLVSPAPSAPRKPKTSPRPTDKDRSSTAAFGAVAKVLLGQFGISVSGFVTEIGGITAARPAKSSRELAEIAASSELFTYDAAAELETLRPSSSLHASASAISKASDGSIVPQEATGSTLAAVAVDSGGPPTVVS